MTKTKFLAKLKKLNACKEALSWVETQEGTTANIWDACEDSSWMLWLLNKTEGNESLLRHLAADFATSVAINATADEELAIAWCVGVARRLAIGEIVEQDEIDAARNAAWSAADNAAYGAADTAAYGADWSAAYGAVYSAAYSAALDAANSAAYGAAYSAANSAASSAAYSAADSAAFNAAYGAARKEQCKIIRARVPSRDIEKMLTHTGH